jgi:hypothetical protein
MNGLKNSGFARLASKEYRKIDSKKLLFYNSLLLEILAMAQSLRDLIDQLPSQRDLLKMEQSPSLRDIAWARTISETLRDLIDLHGLSKITNGSFQGLSVYELDLSGLPDLKIIGRDCFKDLFQLRELRFSPEIERIQSDSFTGCTSLTRLDLSNCAELRIFGAEIFKNCWSLREIIFPENSKISEICAGSFSNCTSLTRLRIPASVRKISGRRTFSGCTQLEEVVFEGDTEVVPDAFQNCPNLARILFLRRKIPGFQYGKYSDLKGILQFDQGESGAICGISLEEFKDDSNIVILPCGHSYIEESFNQWILMQKICPTCKVELE